MSAAGHASVLEGEKRLRRTINCKLPWERSRVGCSEDARHRLRRSWPRRGTDRRRLRLLRKIRLRRSTGLKNVKTNITLHQHKHGEVRQPSISVNTGVMAPLNVAHATVVH